MRTVDFLWFHNHRRQQKKRFLVSFKDQHGDFRKYYIKIKSYDWLLTYSADNDRNFNKEIHGYKWIMINCMNRKFQESVSYIPYI